MVAGGWSLERMTRLAGRSSFVAPFPSLRRKPESRELTELDSGLRRNDKQKVRAENLPATQIVQSTMTNPIHTRPDRVAQVSGTITRGVMSDGRCAIMCDHDSPALMRECHTVTPCAQTKKRICETNPCSRYTSLRALVRESAARRSTTATPCISHRVRCRPPSRSASRRNRTVRCSYNRAIVNGTATAKERGPVQPELSHWIDHDSVAR